jgi:hypothetical protein
MNPLLNPKLAASSPAKAFRLMGQELTVWRINSNQKQSYKMINKYQKKRQSQGLP